MNIIPLDQYQPDETIVCALFHLLEQCDGASTQDKAGFNANDTGEAHYLGSLDTWTPAQELKAWAMMRKYWRQLNKRAGSSAERSFALPKSLPEVLSAQENEVGWEVVNHRNMNSYIVTTDDTGMEPIKLCECDRFSFVGQCKHIDFVNSLSLSIAPRKVLVTAGSADDAPQMMTQRKIASAQEQAISTKGLESVDAVDSRTPILQKSGEICDFELTNDQAIALDRLVEFIRSNGWGNRVFTLQGYAGTGKSTLLQIFVKAIVAQRLVGRVAMAAPTNKAVKVLQVMATKAGLTNIDFYTCHKLLALRPVKGNKKELEFEPDPKEENVFNTYDLVIVDECSMINDSLYDFFIDSLNRFDSNTRLLFVGDSAQLRPVKSDKLSLTFDGENRVELREVVRYSGVIGKVATQIRDGNIPDLATELNDDRSKGVVVFASRQDWESALVNAFTSPRYAENPDYVRAIAYTNKRVQALNELVRSALYPDAPEFVPGERVMAQETYAPENSVLLENSCEYTVLEAQEGRSGKWDTWRLTLANEEGLRAVVPVIRRESLAMFERYLQALANEKRWYEYWQCREAYAVVRYPYALTAHKSQGSTFANVFMDWPELTRKRKEQSEGDRLSLVYTAFTRASHRVFAY